MINRDDVAPTDVPEPCGSERVRPLTWSTWLAWVAAAALVPIGSTTAATVLLKMFARDIAYRDLIMSSFVVIAAMAVLTPPVLQALVLRRVLPRLSIALWLLSLLISVLLWLMLEYAHDCYGPVLFGSRHHPGVQLQLAAMALHPDQPLTMVQLAGLPWWPLLLWTVVASAVTSLFPSWTIGAASGRGGATLLVLFAAIFGASIASVAEQLTTLHLQRFAIDDWALNGLSWPERFQQVAVRAGVGAIWGAATAIPVVVMSNRSEPSNIFAFHRAGFALLLAAPILIAVLSPFIGYLVGLNGIMAGAPELRRALSIAPSRDSTEGEPVIRYSHDVVLTLGPRPEGVIAPDGQLAIVRNADQMLWQVDVATGRPTRQLAEALGPLERHALAWSPDGRYLALRSDGATMAVPGTRYESHQSRVRLYTWPDLTLAGEFSAEQPPCSESYAEDGILFSADGKSILLACDPRTTPQPGDIMALRLEVPTMQVAHIAYFGVAADSGPLRGLKRVETSVWAWQLPHGDKPFRIHDLTTGREIVAASPPPDLISGLTEQFARIHRDSASLKFCGMPPAALASPGPSSWICRTLIVDTNTGALIGHEDQPDNRAPTSANPRIKSVTSGHGLQVEAFWEISSKRGELVVRDEATGRERQRVLSIAQRPLQISHNGHWLMTSAVYGNSLRLYRLHP